MRPITAILCFLLGGVLWGGCQSTKKPFKAPITKVLQFPDEFYASEVQLTGMTGLPLHLGNLPTSGTYELIESGGKTAITIFTARLPAPGINLQVKGRVAMDPKTSLPVIVETKRQLLP